MSQWLTRVAALFTKSGKGRSVPRSRRAHPTIEALEDRLVMSGIFGWGDSGPSYSSLNATPAGWNISQAKLS
jgi:hypothetical protein